MATALFYSVDENRTLCLFDGILHSPTILLLTPLAYAMLFNSKRVLAFLLRDKTGSSIQASCFTADCIDPKGIWFHSYRLLEFSTLLVRRPDAQLYSRLLEAADSPTRINFNMEQRLSCTIYRHKRVVSRSTTMVDNAWEALWCIWREFRNPMTMVDCSSELFIAGCDARKLAARVDFEKVMAACRQTKNSNTHFIYFLQLLIFHGVDMQVKEVLANYVNTLLQLSLREGCDSRARKSLFIAVFNLAGQTWEEFREAIEEMRGILRMDSLSHHDQQSLQMFCVRRLRQLLPGAGFFRHVWLMSKLNESAKRTLMTGLIKHKKFEPSATPTVWKLKPKETKYKMKEERSSNEEEDKEEKEDKEGTETETSTTEEARKGGIKEVKELETWKSGESDEKVHEKKEPQTQSLFP
ncbi:unnamed protein product [Hydatigera taeniaeformis]|uniref:NopRA1 domain-containing protein n=1 Tax=Hydatigena taeniaeformis TaxID=6205 RepID=A0A0R3X4J2_HYDTA|nr:unnamed protein product [Hydatigera taeniaeformis]